MKLSQAVVKEISSAIKELGDIHETEDQGNIYLLEDASVVFGPDANGKPVFQGLSFEMIGRDFHVLSNLELVISESVSNDESSETEVYSVEDKQLVDSISEYLIWRSKLLRQLSI